MVLIEPRPHEGHCSPIAVDGPEPNIPTCHGMVLFINDKPPIAGPVGGCFAEFRLQQQLVTAHAARRLSSII
jgi:hypothetical protein